MARRRANPRGSDARLRQAERAGDPWEILREQLRSGVAQPVEVTHWPGVIEATARGKGSISGSVHRTWFIPPGMFLVAQHSLGAYDDRIRLMPYRLLNADEDPAHLQVYLETPLGIAGDVNWGGPLHAGSDAARERLAYPLDERLTHYASYGGNERPMLRRMIDRQFGHANWEPSEPEILQLVGELFGLPHHKIRLFEYRHRGDLGSDKAYRLDKENRQVEARAIDRWWALIPPERHAEFYQRFGDRREVHSVYGFVAYELGLRERADMIHRHMQREKMQAARQAFGKPVTKKPRRTNPRGDEQRRRLEREDPIAGWLAQLRAGAPLVAVQILRDRSSWLNEGVVEARFVVGETKDRTVIEAWCEPSWQEDPNVEVHAAVHWKGSSHIHLSKAVVHGTYTTPDVSVEIPKAEWPRERRETRDGWDIPQIRFMLHHLVANVLPEWRGPGGELLK